MTNTEQSFRDKWTNNPRLALDQTLNEASSVFEWILTRNGFKDKYQFSNFLSEKKRILDAGCGNGRVTALLRKYSNPVTTEVVGIDLVGADIARKNLVNQRNIFFAKKDLLGDLTDLGIFDFIYCQEVLHHTTDPEKGFYNLVDRLADGGEIAIYVYKQKAPAREFVDDFIREKIGGMSYEDAYKACEQITSLGKMLADLKIKINVPNVDLLGIEAGDYDLQRFVYHFFMKCYWNYEFDQNENVVVNYDWYHPQLCSRHTLDEVREWFVNAGLKVKNEYADFYGITMSGTKAP
jgi:SAM-dependent methyltransferase